MKKLQSLQMFGHIFSWCLNDVNWNLFEGLSGVNSSCIISGEHPHLVIHMGNDAFTTGTFTNTKSEFVAMQFLFTTKEQKKTCFKHRQGFFKPSVPF